MYRMFSWNFIVLIFPLLDALSNLSDICQATHLTEVPPSFAAFHIVVKQSVLNGASGEKH